MTSVSNQQYAPRYEYEMRPKQAPDSSSNNTQAHAKANTPADSTPPRPPVPTEQRGEFSSHNKIVNQQPQGADSKDRIPELTQKNQMLYVKYTEMTEKFSRKLGTINNKIDNLTQQLDTADKKPGEAPPAQANPQQHHAESQAQTPAPETAPSQNTQGGVQSQSQGMDQLIAHTKELKKAFDQLRLDFKTAMDTLSAKFDKLAQLLSKDAPQSETPAGQSDQVKPESSKPTEPSTKTVQQNATSAPVGESTAADNHTVENLMHENQELEKQLDEMERYFEEMVRKSEQQLEALTKKLSQQKH